MGNVLPEISRSLSKPLFTIKTGVKDEEFKRLVQDIQECLSSQHIKRVVNIKALRFGDLVLVRASSVEKVVNHLLIHTIMFNEHITSMTEVL